ncbi:MAG TPA: TRAP transporter small permease [Dongiaceae bacterium]|jgi:TRAP-type C4-dicarboxylate transport system permease small subunit
MDETVSTAAPEPPRAPRVVERIARALALLGGAVALAVAGVVVVSVVRRWLFSEPIPGDFELAQIGTAVAVFAFLPYCQIVRGNIVVDTFTAHLSARARHRIDAVCDLVYSAAMALVAVCLARGTWDMMVSQEVSMVLRIPVWPGVAFGALCCAFLAIAALCTAIGLLRNRS